MQILLVDDEVDILDTYQRLIERKGHEVHIASSSDKAITLIEQQDHFDIIISDYNLDQKSGLDVALIFAENFSKSRIILMSGEIIDTKNLDVKYAHLKFKTLLKPFPISELKKLIASET